MNFIEFYKLKPGDRIVAPKSLAGLVQHHAVYLGSNYAGQNLIGENVYGKHVRVLTAEQFFLANPKVTRIERFSGTNYDRQVAVKRALKLLGQPYDLINFNCEHFANFVQHGKSESNQSKWGIFFGLIALFWIVGLLLKNSRSKF